MEIIFSSNPNGVSIASYTVFFPTYRPFYYNDNYFSAGSYGISIYSKKIHLSGILANKNYIRIENVYGFI